MRDRAHRLAARALALLAMAAGCGGPDRVVEDGGDGGTGGCSRHESCADDELCNGEVQACEPVYGRAWRLSLSNVSLDRTHAPDGEPWDEGGGLPDPFVCLTIGEEEHCTDVEPDTNAPRFDAFTVETVLEQYQHIEVEICDDDAPATPRCWIAAELETIYVPTLRAGTLTLIPDDPARLDDWAVTLSFYPLALEP